MSVARAAVSCSVTVHSSKALQHCSCLWCWYACPYIAVYAQHTPEGSAEVAGGDEVVVPTTCLCHAAQISRIEVRQDLYGAYVIRGGVLAKHVPGTGHPLQHPQ